MKAQNLFILLIVIVSLFSCNNSGQKIDPEKYSAYQQKGVEITTLAQATLLGNVGKAIQKGGPEYAVEFCNLKASSIIDSLNQIHHCVISRVTDKNRNPENKISGQQEKIIWEVFMNNSVNDTVLPGRDKNMVYYKSINIAMAACLKCHGNIDNDITPATLEKLQKLYPNDMATGYQINDFRGLWKVEFQTN